MTTATHPDYAALLRTVLANPDDDAPRLVLADWLDEQPAMVVCGRCKGSGGWVSQDYDPEGVPIRNRLGCPTCSGTGRIPNGGNAERAEFIRLQCRIWQTGKHHCYEVCQLPDFEGCPNRDLRRRERELLDAHGFDWFRDAFHVALPAWNGEAMRDGWESYSMRNREREVGPLSDCKFRRGFIASVSLSLAAFMGEPCGRCHGTGIKHGSPPRDEEMGPLHHAVCVHCEGTGRTEGAARALFQSQPIEKVRLTDRESWEMSHQHHWYNGERNMPYDGIPESANLPRDLFRLLPESFNGVCGERLRVYDSRDAALDALSAACVAYGASLRG